MPNVNPGWVSNLNSNSVQRWKGKLQAAFPVVPIVFLTRWLAVESAGEPNTCGEQGAGFSENGLFQIGEEESVTIGISSEDFTNQCDDGDLSIKVGTQAMAFYR